jgi:hypothetical protein
VRGRDSTHLAYKTDIALCLLKAALVIGLLLFLYALIEATKVLWHAAPSGF